MENLYRIDLEGDELHAKLGGGLPRNSVILVEAKAGIGKSVLSQRFTYGALKNEATVSYVSSELSVQGFFNQMDSFRYDVRADFFSKKLKFVTTFPLLGTVKFKPNLIEEVFKSKEILDSDIIVIDALNDLLIKNDTRLEEAFEFITQTKKLSSIGKTIILTVEPELVSKQVLTLLQNLADVHIFMEEIEQYGNKLNILHVKRFTGAGGDIEKELPFKVRAGIGIVVELASWWKNGRRNKKRNNNSYYKFRRS